MATWYIDHQDGNDANDGTTFALRRKTTSGIVGLAAGDEIRYKKSPDPVSIGNATWNGPPTSVSKVQKLIQAISITSSTNASPIVITSAGHSLSNGDVVAVFSHTVNTNANGVWAVQNVTTDTFELAGSTGNGTGGASGFVYIRSHAVVNLGSSPVVNIASHGNIGSGRTAWTASANVTATLPQSTLTQEGDSYDQIAVAAGFTTGLAAYKAVGTLDLSGHQQLSLWIRQSTGTSVVAGDISIALCSDAAGATPVHTFNVPTLGGVNSSWVPLVFDAGAALSSSIQSIALYVNVDRGAQTFWLSNIMACKAPSASDALTHRSLISKGGTDQWCPIQSIVGTRVIIGAPSGPAVRTGYWGASETVVTYRRETLQMTAMGSGALNTIPANGTLASPITVTGGWNDTDMSTQTGETWIDGVNIRPYAFRFQGTSPNRQHIHLSKMNIVRFYSIDLTDSAFGIKLTDCRVISAASAIDTAFVSDESIQTTPTLTLRNTVFDFGTSDSGAMQGSLDFDGLKVFNADLYLTTMSGKIGSIEFAGCGPQFSGSDLEVDNLSIKYAITSSPLASGSGISVRMKYNLISLSYCFTALTAFFMQSRGSYEIGTLRIRNSSIAYAAGASIGKLVVGKIDDDGSITTGPLRPISSQGSLAWVNNYNGASQSAQYGGYIYSVTDVRHTASGRAWRFNPTTLVRRDWWPLKMPVAKILCTANVQKTVKIWTRRDSTDIKGVLAIKGGQIAGIDSEVSVACEPAVNTWVQSSALTFTPTETGVVEIEFRVYDGVGTTNSFWIDDLEVS